MNQCQGLINIDTYLACIQTVLLFDCLEWPKYTKNMLFLCYFLVISFTFSCFIVPLEGALLPMPPVDTIICSNALKLVSQVPVVEVSIYLFSRPAAGLTNRVPVRDSRGPAPHPTVAPPRVFTPFPLSGRLHHTQR